MTQYRIKKTTRNDGSVFYTIEYKDFDDIWRGVRNELYYKLSSAKKAIDKLRGNQIEGEEIIDY